MPRKFWISLHRMYALVQAIHMNTTSAEGRKQKGVNVTPNSSRDAYTKHAVRYTDLDYLTAILEPKYCATPIRSCVCFAAYLLFY